MSNFLLIFVSLGFGALMGRLKILPQDAYKSINAWLVYLVIPAVSLRFVPEIEWNTAVLVPLLAPFVIWGGAWVFVRCYDMKVHLSPASRTALLITCGLGNTGFFGFPMITAFYGEGSIQEGIVLDQLTFVVFATLGVTTILKAAESTKGNQKFSAVFGKVLRFPPFIGFLLALILPHLMDMALLNPLLDKLVATMSPMSLFSIAQGPAIKIIGLLFDTEIFPILTVFICICDAPTF